MIHNHRPPAHQTRFSPRYPAMLALLAAGLGIATVTPAHAATIYTQVDLLVEITGTSVVAHTTVTANPQVSVESYTVCVRDSVGANRDFNKVPATITPAGTAYTSHAKTFVAGTYTYWPCLYADGSWHNVGATKQFTVGLPELGFSVNGASGPIEQEHYNALRQITPGPVWARIGFSSDGNWQATADSYFNAATAAGLKVLLRASFPGAQWNGSEPVDVDAYGDFVAAMAARYKGAGVGSSNPVIELPNEINGTQINGATYAAAACNAYPKLKAVDPTYKIIGASENVYASNWKTWLTDVYNGGFTTCSDGVSFHNYDIPADGARYTFLRSVMTQYDDLDAMVWLTEFGASTCAPATGTPLGCQTEQQQADKIVGNLTDLRDNYPWITHAFVYTDEDIPSLKQSDPFEAYFGIYRNDAAGNVTGAKPAVAAIKSLYE